MKAIQPLFLFLIAFLVGADEFLLGPILTPIGDDLGVMPERITLFITAYSLPLALLAPFFGFLSDRHGRLAVLLPATAMFAAASILTGLVSSFEWGIATRILTGIAGAGMLPIAFAMAADQRKEQAAKAISYAMGGLTTGIIVSPGLGALTTEIWSWRAPFILLGVAALMTLLPAFFVARKTKGAPSTGEGQEAGGAIFVPGALGALLAMFFGLGGAVGTYSMVGERLRDALLFDTRQIGMVYAAFGVLSVAGNLLAPPAIKWLGDGRRAMRLCLAIILPSIAVVFALPYPAFWVVAIALALWAVLGGIGAPGLETYISQLSVARRGVLLALSASATNLGVAFSAAMAGEAYLLNSTLVAVQGAVLLFIAILVLAKPRRAPAEQMP